MDRRTFNATSFRAIGLGVFSTAVLAACQEDDPVVPSAPHPQLSWDTAMTFTAQYPAGGVIELQWSSQGVEWIDIQLVAVSQEQIVLAIQVPAEDQFCRCPIPDNLAGEFRVMITDTADPTVAVTSPNLEIVEALRLTLAEVPAVNTVLTLDFPTLGTISIRRQSDTQVEVLNLECPHNGCTVAYFVQFDGFECPCHGSAFTTEGCVTGGPAEDSLSKYEASWFYPESKQLFVLAGSRTSAC